MSYAGGGWAGRAAAMLFVLGGAAWAQVNAPWSSQDIGSPATAGSASQSGATFTVAGGGTDIWDMSDQFQFACQPQSGNLDIVARVASQGNTDGWAKAGLMVRQSLDADAANALIAVTPSNGVSFQCRVSPGAASTFISDWTSPALGWLRLVRAGNTFKGYRSADGTNWTFIGCEGVPMTGTVYVGLAVTSHNAGAVSTAVFENVAVNLNPVDAANSLTASAAGSGTGLQGQYWNLASADPAPAFPGTAADRTAASGEVIDFDDSVAGGWPFFTGGDQDSFAVRWTGSIVPRYTATYIFYILADDGCRLWINGQSLIDDWRATPAAPRVGRIALTADVAYNIVVEYYENIGGARVEFRWTLDGSGSLELGIVPLAQTLPTASPVGGTTPPWTVATSSPSSSDDGREGKNGDDGINDTLCGGSVGATGPGFSVGPLAGAALALMALRRRRAGRTGPVLPREP